MPILKLSDPETRIRTASTFASGLVTPVSVDVPFSVDAYMRLDTPTVNNGGATTIDIGNQSGSITFRSWAKIDFSLIPAGRILLTGVMNLTPTADNSANARVLSAHRCLVAPVENQITWNIFSTGNNWPGSGGASTSGTDYEATALGTMVQPASPTLNVPLPMTFTAAGIAILQQMYDGALANDGMILFVATQAADRISYASSEHGTPSLRPFITFTYI